MSGIEDKSKTLFEEWWSAYIATMEAYNEVCRQATVEWRKINGLLNRIESAWRKCCHAHKLKKYLRTGIKPKYQNRTRKKQRLTRLQKRWKRQRK